jgi:LacI family transcriptional regulator
VYQGVSLKDIAEKAGCSINTVSLALKDSRRISEATRKKVQDIANDFQYVSNNMARSLVLKRTGIIGLILRNISSLYLTTEARYIEQYLEKRGYTMFMAASRDDPKIEAKVIKMMLSNKIDGLIVNTKIRNNLSFLEKLRERGLPVVLISGFTFEPGIDSVYPDLIEGAYRMMQHLLSLNYTKIMFVTGEPDAGTAEDLKFLGFQKALTEKGLSAGQSWNGVEDLLLKLTVFNGTVIDEEGQSKLVSFAHHADAFFVCDDELAISVIKALSKNGIRVPADVAVASLDNVRFAESCAVPLTTVGFDLQCISHRAVDMLLDGIETDLSNAGGTSWQHIKVVPELFIRESCGSVKI